MKKFSILLLSIAVLMLSACTKTNDEKAQELVKDYLQEILYHPESYKPRGLQLDSAFFDMNIAKKTVSIFLEIKDLAKKLNEYNRDMEWAQIEMDSYNRSKYYGVYSSSDKQKYAKAKDEYSFAKKMHDKIYDSFCDKYSELSEVGKGLADHKFSGWGIEHKYSSLNSPGTMQINATGLFMCDKEFITIIELNINDLESMYKFAEEMQMAETQEQVEKILKDLNY